MMSRPIKMTETILSEFIKKFNEAAKELKLEKGKISFETSFENKGERAELIYSPVAFAKQTVLVQSFTSEVAWHGVVVRDKNNMHKFYVKDIIVYPQEVTGSTVNTDQEKYTNWLYQFDEDTFNEIKMQGHSHVNFDVHPSGVDTTHQEQIINELLNEKDMFYIFVIWNKKFEKFVNIYDMKNNAFYDTSDVDVIVGENNVDLAKFLEESKDQVKDKPKYEPKYEYYQEPPKKNKYELEFKNKNCADWWNDNDYYAAYKGYGI